ncbi:cytochrome c oxidase subunit 3 [Aureispira]|nr:cytochrome c oxidase subunit 3 [Aureispira sp.]
MMNYTTKKNNSYKIPIEKVGLYWLLISLSMLFIAFSIGYVFTRSQNSTDGVYLPPIFLINSFVLIGSSYFINLANKAYKNDNTKQYQYALAATMLLTIIFMFLQLLGWFYFKEILIGENIGNGVNYLYALSGLHYAHIIGGLPFLSIFLYNAFKKLKEPMTVLIYFSDPSKKIKLQLLTIYWHFLDGLWVFLVLFFLVNMIF